MGIDPPEVAGALTGELKKLGSPEYAEGARRYLKSDLTFFGTRLPDIRKTIRTFLSSHDLDRASLVELVEELWSEPIHERKMAATVLLEARTKLLASEDVPMLERLIRESFTWAYVDPLSTNVGGQMWVAGTMDPKTLDRWSQDADFWIRRASLLVLLKPVKSGRDFERFARYADAMLEEKEFFIRKAIGWVLRELSKKEPEVVQAWIEPRLDRMSGVTRREAIKYLPTVRSHRPARS